MDKPPCKYGTECYRKNPTHFKEFSHPHVVEDDDHNVSREDRSSSESGPPTKKIRVDESTQVAGSACCPSPQPPVRNKPYLFKLTTVRGIQSCYNSNEMSLGIKDILSESVGDLLCSAQFNYLFDVPWLIQQYPESKRKTPIMLVYGDQREATMQLRKEAKLFPNITLCPAKLEIMFGTHHSKMMFLLYTTGLRIVIHTANLIAKDWDQKTQGVWMSPIFPLREKSPASEPHPSATGKTTAPCSSSFQQDLLQYLEAYGGSSLGDWKRQVASHDMASARVRLIASVPGAHKGANMHKWGHLKLKKVLSQCVTNGSVDKHWPVVGQFSSIGSLGPSPDNWLAAEWLQSLSSANTAGQSSLCAKAEAELKLIFPSVENVRSSLEGYMAGGSIPYSLQNAQKQSYLKHYFCKWKAVEKGRSRAAPHIKTYCRLSPDSNAVLWFLLTSANLSKAAWGCLEKKGTQLKIRSYEIGVLFLPSDHSDSLSSSIFQLKGQADGVEEKGQNSVFDLIPYDLPLTPYSEADEPWVWNAKYRQPDSHGNMWTPPG